MSGLRTRDGSRFVSPGPFAVECPGCRETVGAARELVGRVAGCPRCRAAFVVPDPAGAEEGHAGASRGRRRDPDRRNVDHPSPTAPRETTPLPSNAPMTTPSIAPSTTTPAPRQPWAAPRPPADPASTAPRAATDDEPLVFSEPPLPASRLPPGAAVTPVPPAAAPLTDPTDTAPTVAAVTPVPAAGNATPVADGGDATNAAVLSPAAIERSAGAAAEGELAFRDPVRTVRSGGTEIELHRLTPEERRSRRARRNLLILLVGAALLVALVVILGTRGR